MLSAAGVRAATAARKVHTTIIAQDSNETRARAAPSRHMT